MEWDYLIVGAGAAGSALAARLTEDPTVGVLLLEAGPNYRSAEQPREMRSPNPFNIILPRDFQAVYMWPSLEARRTARQDYRIYWRGRGVGGSTAINGQIAIRGVLDAFDGWAEQGADGWSGAQVLPFFNKLEDDPDFGGRPYHGRGGPIPIYHMPQAEWGPVDKALRDAALEAGHPWTDDLNAPEAEGVTTYAINSRDGKRVSSNDGYLEPARGRPNLEIVGDALVDRVLLEGTTAVGVRVLLPTGPAELRAREVILSAGAIHTPPILLRSGLGPAAHLAQMGIPLVRDLPVGEGLFDHPFVRIDLKLLPHLRPSSVDARHTNCCVKYSSHLGGGGKCDMLFIAINHGGVGVEMDEDQFGEAGLHVSLFEAFSRGRLTLRSPDPEVQPDVDLNMLADERDLIRMRDAARRLIAMGRTSHFTSIVRSPITLGSTGRPIQELWQAPDAAVDDWVLTDCSDAQHGAGSCRMGPFDFDDGTSVVDPACRVRGIAHLRVIDASIMPADCKANTNLTTIMIGERMADRLKAERARG
jgi:choline dehydrogenase